jgi:hypothetical protein
MVRLGAPDQEASQVLTWSLDRASGDQSNNIFYDNLTNCSEDIGLSSGEVTQGVILDL